MATTKATNLGHRSDVTLKGTTTTIETDVVVSDTTTINNAGDDVGLKINSTSTGHIMQLQDNGTDVMVVKDGGNVGIGVTSPLSPLHQINPGSSDAGEIRVGGNATAFGIKLVYDQSSSTTGTIYSSPTYTNSNAVLKLGCGSGNTDQLVLKGDGNCGIGYSSPSSRLHVNGVLNGDILKLTGAGTESRGLTVSNFQVSGVNGVGVDFDAVGSGGVQGTLSFSTNSTERLRINSSGNVGIQQTSPSSATGATTVLHIGSSSSASSSVVIQDNEAKWDLEVNGSLNFALSGSTKARINSSTGDFYTNDGTVSSLSDIRVKKNVADLNDGLDIVNQLRPKTFEYNGLGEMTEAGGDGIQRYGFIADEVLEVAPHYITVGKGKIDNKEVDDMKSLALTRMIPMMIKAIQELSAKVTALENA